MVKFRRADVERMLIGGAAGLVLLLAIRGTQTGTLGPEPYEEPLDQIPVEQTAAIPQGPTQPTVVYYEDGEGYLVPVQRQIEKQAGIAKATLALMVQNPANDMEAARLGLRNVIPEGTSFGLDIVGGKARVDLGRQALSATDAGQEANMVSAMVYALTEFPTVQEVEFLVDGQKRSKLTHGTDISGTMHRQNLNLESVDAQTTLAGSQQVRIYFPSDNGRLLVPVTRTVFSDADVNTAVLELAKGPRKDSGLQTPLPGDVGLIDVKVRDGVATVNFTQEFARIAEQSDGGQQALRALVLTCTQFPGVKQVKVQVNGKDYALPSTAAQPTFANVAEVVAQQFPGVVEMD
ncbi:MAG: GerMN domain-containing protein [Oscillospiraceae bacterium]|jgi:germination protein M|nr:GerMN domain-containing protein [Oscillospiraceae bacterium]